LQVILLTVDQAVLRERLLARGRESLPQIEARLARNAEFTDSLLAADDPSLSLLDNSGPLRQSLEMLFKLLGK
jgi:ribose 1,5-bisphosphokinase